MKKKRYKFQVEVSGTYEDIMSVVALAPNEGLARELAILAVENPSHGSVGPGVPYCYIEHRKSGKCKVTGIELEKDVA